ncbi:hypothetical protein Vretifemale_4756, partial [Volvox reticuliferus]
RLYLHANSSRGTQVSRPRVLRMNWKGRPGGGGGGGGWEKKRRRKGQRANAQNTDIWMDSPKDRLGVEQVQRGGEANKSFAGRDFYQSFIEEHKDTDRLANCLPIPSASER